MDENIAVCFLDFETAKRSLLLLLGEIKNSLILLLLKVTNSVIYTCNMPIRNGVRNAKISLFNKSK